MSETFNTGDIVEITATGKIEAVYGDDKYLVRVHGESVPMFGSQMRKEPTREDRDSSGIEAVKERIHAIVTKQGFEVIEDEKGRLLWGPRRTTEEPIESEHQS